jgi:hypothetical protein
MENKGGTNLKVIMQSDNVCVTARYTLENSNLIANLVCVKKEL